MAKAPAISGFYYTRLKPGVINRSLDVALVFNLVKVPKFNSNLSELPKFFQRVRSLLFAN